MGNGDAECLLVGLGLSDKTVLDLEWGSPHSGVTALGTSVLCTQSLN